MFAISWMAGRALCFYFMHLVKANSIMRPQISYGGQAVIDGVVGYGAQGRQG